MYRSLFFTGLSSGPAGPVRKALLCFKSTYGALYPALNAVRCSTTGLLACLDEPEPGVDAAGDLGEDIGGIGILKCGRLRAGIACMSPKVGECRRKRSDVAVPTGCRQPISVKRRSVSDRARRSLCYAAQLRDAPGNQVRVLLHALGDLTEQLAQGYEMGSSDVPVGLPALQLQIDGVG
jgi:hypothetical protein